MKAAALKGAPTPPTWPAPTFDPDLMKSIQAQYVVVDRWRCEGLEALARELWRRLDVGHGHAVQGDRAARRRLKRSPCYCEWCVLVRTVFELKGFKP